MTWRPERGWGYLLARAAALVASLAFLAYTVVTTPGLDWGRRPSETVRDVDEGSPVEERRLVDLIERQGQQESDGTSSRDADKPPSGPESAGDRDSDDVDDRDDDGTDRDDENGVGEDGVEEDSGEDSDDVAG